MYIYGDFSTGTVWMISADSQQGAIGEVLVNTMLNISSFTNGKDGPLCKGSNLSFVNQYAHVDILVLTIANGFWRPQRDWVSSRAIP